MRLFVTYAILASATLAVASIDPRFEFPDAVPAIERRQEPGTPLYQCHEDCGLLITLGRTDGYCSNAEWNERYSRCMSCANTYNIWQYYGTSVTRLAQTCGLTPAPSPSAAPAVAARIIDPRFEYPDTVPSVEKRQEPGTPRYQCHEDCGLLITLGRTDGYCSNSEWNERFGRCMICANTFNIWQYYGQSVSDLAEECGLTPSPSVSGFSESAATTVAAQQTSASTPTQQTTTAASQPTETHSSTAIPATSGAATTLSTAQVSPAATPTPSQSVVSGASGNIGFASAAIVVVLAVLAVF